MLRRIFIQAGLTAAVSSICAPAEHDATSWGALSTDLRLGLRVERHHAAKESMLALIENTSPEPCDLYLFDGNIARISFTATSVSGAVYKLYDRELYTPCAGLCHFPPRVQHLEAFATLTVSISTANLIYASSAIPSLMTLSTLLGQGCSVEASFETSASLVGAGKLVAESVWIGKIQSGKAK